MAVTATPIFVQSPLIGYVDLTSAIANTNRAKVSTATITGASTTYFQLLATSTNGVRIDSIQVNACPTAIAGATVAGLVSIWIHDGTNAQIYTEIAITAVTPSATSAAFTTTLTLVNPLVLPSTYKLYASSTIALSGSTTALQVFAFGGSY